MLKKIEIILWVASGLFSYGVFLAVLYTNILGSYAKFLAAALTIAYINAVGVHIWKRIQ